jgi:hypothetical protein
MPCLEFLYWKGITINSKAYSMLHASRTSRTPLERKREAKEARSGFLGCFLTYGNPVFQR